MTISIYIHKSLSYSVTYYCTQLHLFLHGYIFYFCTYFSSTYLFHAASCSLHPHSYKSRNSHNYTTVLSHSFLSHLHTLQYNSLILHSFSLTHSFSHSSLQLFFFFIYHISLSTTFSQHHHSFSAASAFSQPNAEQLSYIFMAQLICKTQYWSHSFSQDRNVMSH